MAADKADALFMKTVEQFGIAIDADALFMKTVEQFGIAIDADAQREAGTALVDETDLWRTRRGLSLGLTTGVGQAYLLGLEAQLNLGRVSFNVVPQYQLRLGNGGGYSLLGAEVGARVHLLRRLSVGAGLAPGAITYQVRFASAEFELDLALRPVIVRLGDAEQFQLSLYVPVALIGPPNTPTWSAFFTVSYLFPL